MLNPVWLKTFATVTNCRSFTEAGRQLGLNQSSVSEHIRRLEESVGRRLFVRDTHSIAMTADGEALLVHANVILQALNRAESQFRKPRLQGLVRLGAPDDLALVALPDVLATGVGSVAVVSAVTGADDYRTALVALQQCFARQFDNH